VGLSGEVRAVSRIEQRIQEAERLGFKEIYISKYNMKGIEDRHHSIRVIGISSVVDLLEQIFV